MITTVGMLVLLWAPLLTGGWLIMRWAARLDCDYEHLRRADRGRRALRRAVERGR